jgi:hypothetical protein
MRVPITPATAGPVCNPIRISIPSEISSDRSMRHFYHVQRHFRYSVCRVVAVFGYPGRDHIGVSHSFDFFQFMIFGKFVVHFRLQFAKLQKMQVMKVMKVMKVLSWWVRSSAKTKPIMVADLGCDLNFYSANLQCGHSNCKKLFSSERQQCGQSVEFKFLKLSNLRHELNGK